MMKIMLRRWAFACLVALFVAQPNTLGEYPSTPARVVRLYCDFDLNTGRISTENFEKLPSIVTWEEEPGWDTVVVVSGYKILSSKQTLDHAVVTVQWAVLGYAEAENVSREKKSEVIVYQLKLLKGLWKIDSPIVPPHVSLPTLRTFVLKHFQSEPKRQSLWLKNLDALRQATQTSNRLRSVPD
jgi:hypothetical protein